MIKLTSKEEQLAEKLLEIFESSSFFSWYTVDFNEYVNGSIGAPTRERIIRDIVYHLQPEKLVALSKEFSDA